MFGSDGIYEWRECVVRPNGGFTVSDKKCIGWYSELKSIPHFNIIRIPLYSFPTRICPEHGITIPILIIVQRIRCPEKARKGVPGCKGTTRRIIPPCAEIDQPLRVQFAREAEGRWRVPACHHPERCLHIDPALLESYPPVAAVQREREGAVQWGVAQDIVQVLKGWRNVRVVR